MDADKKKDNEPQGPPDEVPVGPPVTPQDDDGGQGQPPGVPVGPGRNP